MSKADEKELEESKHVYDELKRNKEIIDSVDKDFFFKFSETILQQLKRLQEETVEKAKIREKIEEIEKAQDRVKNNNLIYSREDVFRFQIYILEEILEQSK